jgi:integrase
MHGHVPRGFNPARDIKRYREQGRERYLSSDEIIRLGQVLRQAETGGLPWTIKIAGPRARHLARPENRREIYPRQVTNAIRLLLYTGCRLREILYLRWTEVDFERGLLHLPDSKTGRKTIVLNVSALDVIAGCSRIGAFVIAGDRPDRPRHDLKRPWEQIREAAGLGSVRLHDLRHTHASIGVAAGLGLPIVGKLLGHASQATTARYAHLADDPVRRASDLIGGRIAALIGYD